MFGWGEVDFAGLPHEFEPGTEVPEGHENTDELVAILAALGSNRIVVSERTFAIRPDSFQPSRGFNLNSRDNLVRLPRLHAWLPELERPIVQHRGRPRQSATTAVASAAMCEPRTG
jgi:hypothetical protein